MAGPTLVGTNKIAGSSATASVNGLLPSSVTAGNTIMVAVSCDSDTVPSATAVSDGVNTYTRIVSRAGGLSGGSPVGATAQYIATNVAAGSTTVTFNNTGNAGGATSVAISVAEVTASNGTTDGTSGNNATTTGTPNPGAITTTNAADSIFVSAVNSINNTTWTVGTGYTLLATVTSAANTTIGFQYQSFSTTVTSQSTAFGNSSTAGWTAAAVAIEAATGGGFTWQSLAEIPDLIPTPTQMIAY